MKMRSPIVSALVLACSLILTACGGSNSGDDDPPQPVSTVTIEGTAEAPGGVVAQFESKPFAVAVVDLVFSSAQAALSGLQPITGATVELIRIDDDGNQVGAVLANTTTSITGDYSLQLPTGVDLSGDLVVRISGNGGASMSAMVVDQAVDINPVSQYVLDKFVNDPTLKLADLAVNEVVALTGKVEEFDLSASIDLASTLEALDASLGELVDTEIAVINSTPDSGSATTAAVGNWNIIEFGLSMHDNETQDFGTLGADVYGEELSVATGGSPGQINITIGNSFIDAWTNLSVGGNFADIYHETSMDTGGDTIPATIDSNGNVTLTIPFEEDLQTVNVGDPQTDPESDGPDFGWRWPPATITLNNTGNDNLLVLLDSSAGVRYKTTDTNSDGVKDAVDPNVKDGDEAEMMMTLLLKEGSGMSTASLNGDYGIVTLSLDVNTSPSSTIGSTVGAVSFNGGGTATVAASAFDEISIDRTLTNGLPDLSNITLQTNSRTDGSFNILYTVADDGRVSLDTEGTPGDPSDDTEGYTNDDGSFAALVKVQTSGDPIGQVFKELVLVTKLPISKPDMASAVYKLYPLVRGMEENGLTELVSLRGTSTLTFNAGETAATGNFTARGYERATDIASVTAITPESETVDFNVVTLAADGEIQLNHTATGISETLHGYVSADGKIMILRFVSTDTTMLNNDYKSLGTVLAIRQ